MVVLPCTHMGFSALYSLGVTSTSVVWRSRLLLAFFVQLFTCSYNRDWTNYICLCMTAREDSRGCVFH